MHDACARTSTLQQHIQMCTVSYEHVPLRTGTLQHVHARTGTYRHRPARSGTYRRPPVAHCTPTLFSKKTDKLPQAQCTATHQPHWTAAQPPCSGKLHNNSARQHLRTHLHSDRAQQGLHSRIARASRQPCMSTLDNHSAQQDLHWQILGWRPVCSI